MTRRLDAHTRAVLLHQGRDAGLSDADLARQVGVARPTITRWRARLGLGPSPKFAARFRRTYGPDALERFQRLRQEGLSLRAIGATFGFSAEYARQVAAKLDGRPQQRAGEAGLRWPFALGQQVRYVPYVHDGIREECVPPEHWRIVGRGLYELEGMQLPVYRWTIQPWTLCGHWAEDRPLVVNTDQLEAVEEA